MENKNVFKTWAVNQSLGFVLGWFFHGVISHLFTGEHEFSLSVPQLIMHNISLLGMAGILLYFQNKATMQLFEVSLIKYWPAYVFIPVLLFWIGYYGIGAPMDLVFSFMTIAVLNGIYLARALKLKRWLLFSILSSVVGIIVGTIIVTPVEPAILPYFAGLTKHIIVFILEGSAIGIPMAVFGGFMLQRSMIKKLRLMV